MSQLNFRINFNVPQIHDIGVIMSEIISIIKFRFYPLRIKSNTFAEEK